MTLDFKSFHISLQPIKALCWMYNEIEIRKFSPLLSLVFFISHSYSSSYNNTLSTRIAQGKGCDIYDTMMVLLSFT